MFRVVTDRERWFNIVMGEKFNLDEKSTEKFAHPASAFARVSCEGVSAEAGSSRIISFCSG